MNTNYGTIPANKEPGTPAGGRFWGVWRRAIVAAWSAFAPGALAAVVAAAVLLIPAAAAFSQTPDIKWYTKNHKAKNYQLSTADELAGLAALVNNTAGLEQIDLAKYGHRSSTISGEYETDNSGKKNCAVDFKGRTITLAKDIDVSKYCHGSKFNDGKGWIPIGYCDGDGECYGAFVFSGVFDGNGKAISGLVSKDMLGGDHEGRRTYNPGGLFGDVSGTVKNIGIVGANVTGGGGIVGTLSGGSVSNCYFTGTVIGDTANGWASVGGIVGWMLGGSVTNCYFAGTANGSGVAGGIVGDVEKGSVSNCYSLGTVSGESGVGGIAGTLSGGEISLANTYSLAAVSGKSSVGGIVGYVSNLVKTKEYVQARVEVMEMGFGNAEQRISEKELSKVFKKKLEAIKIFDTLKTAVSSNIALNSSVKAAGSKEHVALITVPSWEEDQLCFRCEPYRAPDSSFSRGGRVVGGNDAGRLSGNAAFSGVLNKAGNTMWDDRNASGINGEDITVGVIKADGTLGGRFTRKNGWIVQNGKLPGLFGETVEMPTHLK